MSREERKTFTIGIIACAIYIILAVYFYTLPVDAKKAVFTDDSTEDEYFIEETDETPKTPFFDANSAMPCCDPEGFQKWMETYEQETSEEDADEAFNVEVGEEMGRYSNRQEEIEAENLSNAEEMETAQSDNVRGASQSKVVYSVNGETLNPELQAYLYQRLSDHNIEWFMPYAVLIAYQESRFDIYAQNPNMQDKGLFQFRLAFYPGQDIFNPYEQIDIFCQQMANRANAGCDVYEMISRHNVSDWGQYNATYVSQVMAHEANLREVE